MCLYFIIFDYFHFYSSLIIFIHLCFFYLSLFICLFSFFLFVFNMVVCPWNCFENIVSFSVLVVVSFFTRSFFYLLFSIMSFSKSFCCYCSWELSTFLLIIYTHMHFLFVCFFLFCCFPIYTPISPRSFNITSSPFSLPITSASLGYFYGQKDLAFYIDNGLSRQGSCDAASSRCSSSTLSEAHTVHSIFTDAVHKFFDLWATVHGRL